VTFGVYVHIPFCAHRCDYCDFATWTDRAHLIDAYVDACIADIERHDAPAATSVFFGGGTPSLLPASQLTRILDAIHRTPDAEVTVECNPDSVDPDKFGAYRAAGANRVSIGMQSIVPHVLQGLNRTHNPANVERAIAAAHDAGIARVSVDLIYGTAGESVDDWRASLSAALALDVEHVSAYALTIEPGTPLGKAIAAGHARPPDDDDQAEKYAIADETLSRHGYQWYEISNWARPAAECRHNLCYWQGDDYLAIGCAAHGYTNGERWWNVRTPDRYIELVTSGASPVAGRERLEPDARSEEAFALALRTRAGTIPTPAMQAVVADLAEQGLVDRAGDRIVLTRRGRLLASDVTARLLTP
jgi:oxygen-independent coproporphyrinogen-3 oxidase